MNYIGSKYSLLDFIHRTISDVTGYKSGDDYIFADLFAGTGVVGASYRKEIEIQHDVAKEAYDRINTEKNDVVRTKVVVADSQT